MDKFEVLEGVIVWVVAIVLCFVFLYLGHELLHALRPDDVSFGISSR